MPNISDAFDAKPESVWEFLTTNGQGCYIPPYQRPYAWTDEQISRLLEDAAHGVDQMERHSDTINFLGAIISIHDTKHQTVLPVDRVNVAPRVMVIIDGQQRISTIVMSNIVLHDHIKRAFAKLGGPPKESLENTAYSWLANEYANLLDQLRDTYLIDRKTGDKNCRYYPRIIRAYQDKWSRNQSEMIYKSPIAELIWQYINFSENSGDPEPKGKFELSVSDKTIEKAFASINRYISKQICVSSRFDKQKLLDLIGKANRTPESFWDSPPPEGMFENIQKQDGMKKLPAFCNLLQLISFTRYINHRMAVTVVVAKNEDDAFDMFDALNTTGQLLTAFETFVPTVIRKEGLAGYRDSESCREITKVETYIKRFPKDKEKKTSEMLVAFALAETGRKLLKRLNLQRRYLRKEYDNFSTDQERMQFVQSMAGTALFLDNGWDLPQESPLKFSPLNVNDEEALVAFKALCKIGHTITIAPLSRFYRQASDPRLAKDGNEIQALIDAIKATAAFAFLWRGAKGGAGTIDQYYRKIMRDGMDDLPPMARRPETGKQPKLDVGNYKHALRKALEEEDLFEKEHWVDVASKIDIYAKHRDVARFLLFCAADDAIPDESGKGLIKKGRRGTEPLLTVNQWHSEALLTIEHIAPQSPEIATWDSEIYGDEPWSDTLGNLTLLPADENNAIGNKSWEIKKLWYQLLSAQDSGDFERIKKQLEDVEIGTSKTAQEVIQNSRYLTLCRSLAQCQKEWTLATIQERSRCLAELAWDRLSSWLY